MIGKQSLVDAKDLATIAEAVAFVRPELADLKGLIARCKVDGVEVSPDLLNGLNDGLDQFEAALFETSRKLNPPGSDVLLAKRMIREVVVNMVGAGLDPAEIRGEILGIVAECSPDFPEEQRPLLASSVQAVLDEVLGNG
jgi:hypothetical protein